MKNSKKLLSVLLTFIMTFSLMIGGLTTAFATAAPVVTNTQYINSTNQTTYAITGTGIAGATVDVTVTDSATTPATVVGSGTVDDTNNFSIPVNVSALAEGNISITATQTDASVVSLASAPVSVIKDTVAPTATISGVTDGQITNQSVTPTATGGDTYAVTLTNNGTEVMDYTIGDVITTEGSYVLSVTPTDAADNTGSAIVVNFTIDKTAPTALTVNTVGDSDTVVNGSAEVGSTVTVTAGTTTLGTGTADLNGTYSVTIADQVAGTSLSVTATDVANNVSLATTTVVVDNTAPTAPTVDIIDGALYDANGATPTISSAPIDATQTITLDGSAYTSGEITIDGAHELVITNTDAAGNFSSIIVNFTVDAVIPVITIVGSSTVTVAQGSTYTDAGATASDNINVGITASIALSGTVDTNTVGSYILTYNVSDAAGNPAVAVTRTVNVIPAAPAVTNDDTANTVTGMTTAMEYNLDDAGYVLYDAIIFDAVDLSGEHTLLVRVAEDGINPAGLDTTLAFITTLGEDKKITSITGNNILLVGDYAFDLSDSENNNYDLNNFMIASQTAYSDPVDTYHVYFRIGDAWYDIASDSDMSDKITDLSTINGTGLFNYMNMQ